MAVKKETQKNSSARSKAGLKKPAIKRPVEKSPVNQIVNQEAKPIEEPKLEEPKAEEPKVDTTGSELKPQRSIDRGSLFLGASMLVIGIIWLLSHYLHIPLADYLWPFVIILPGILLFISSLNMENNRGEALSVIGSILTSTGLLLFIQMLTDTWASWAYAWALVAPTSIGLGQMIFGHYKRNQDLQKDGWQMAKVGLIIFAVGLCLL